MVKIISDLNDRCRVKGEKEERKRRKKKRYKTKKYETEVGGKGTSKVKELVGYY